MKLPKDARQSVRYSSELYGKLKEQGWTIQKLLDWGVDQHVEIDIKARMKSPTRTNENDIADEQAERPS